MAAARRPVPLAASRVGPLDGIDDPSAAAAPRVIKTIQPTTAGALGNFDELRLSTLARRQRTGALDLGVRRNCPSSRRRRPSASTRPSAPATRSRRGSISPVAAPSLDAAADQRRSGVQAVYVVRLGGRQAQQSGPPPSPALPAHLALRHDLDRQRPRPNHHQLGLVDECVPMPCRGRSPAGLQGHVR